MQRGLGSVSLHHLTLVSHLMTDTAGAKAIFEGTCEYPPGADPATQLLLEEAAITHAVMGSKEVATYVHAEDFKY